jgi:hypothetical protein
MIRPEQIHQRSTPDDAPIVIRPAAPTDGLALERLAQLDSTRSPAGDVLVAERAGALVAAVGLESGTVIADPFQRTADVTAMLALRRRGLIEQPARRPRRLVFGALRPASRRAGLVGIGS